MYLILERGEGREKERERNIYVSLVPVGSLWHAPNQDQAHSPGMCSWQRIERVTFWFVGWCPTHCTTLLRASFAKSVLTTSTYLETWAEVSALCHMSLFPSSGLLWLVSPSSPIFTSRLKVPVAVTHLLGGLKNHPWWGDASSKFQIVLPCSFSIGFSGSSGSVYLSESSFISLTGSPHFTT